MKGQSVVQRYYGHSEPAVDADGWFDTGDLARIRSDGALHITGRAKDLIKSGGEWINPAEIEAIIAGQPTVAQVAVIARVDPKWESAPCWSSNCTLARSATKTSCGHCETSSRHGGFRTRLYAYQQCRSRRPERSTRKSCGLSSARIVPTETVPRIRISSFEDVSERCGASRANHRRSVSLKRCSETCANQSLVYFEPNTDPERVGRPSGSSLRRRQSGGTYVGENLPGFDWIDTIGIVGGP